MNHDPKLAIRSVHAALWVLVFSVVRQILLLGFGIVIARLLTPADFGTVAICALFYSLGHLFVDGGFGLVLIKKKDVTAADISTVFVYNMTLALIGMVTMALLARPLSQFYDITLLATIVRVYAILLPIGALGAVPRALLYRELRQGLLNICDLIGGVVGAVTGIVLALYGFGAMALVAQTIATTVVVTIALCVCTRWRPRFMFCRSSFFAMFKTGSFILTANLLDAVFLNIYNLWIGRTGDTTKLGYYTRGRDYAWFIVNQINEVCVRIGLPAFSKLQDDVAALRDAFLKMLAVVETVFWFPAFLLFTLASPIVEFVLTDKWLPTVPYWRIFLLISVFFPLLCLCQQGVLACNRSGRFLLITVLSKCFHLINLAVSIYGGIICLTIGQVVIFAINSMLAFYLFRREIKCSLRDVLSVSLTTGLLVAVSCSAACGIYHLLVPISLFLSLVTASLSAAVLYWVLNRYFCTIGYVSVVEILLSRHLFLHRARGLLLREKRVE